MPSSKALSNDEQKEASKVCKGERPLTAFCWLPLVGFCYPCRPLFVPLCVFFSKRLHCTAVHVWSCLGRRRHSSCCCCRCWLQKAVLPLTVSQGIQWYVSSIVQRLEMLDGYGDSGSSDGFFVAEFSRVSLAFGTLSEAELYIAPLLRDQRTAIGTSQCWIYAWIQELASQRIVNNSCA